MISSIIRGGSAIGVRCARSLHFSRSAWADRFFAQSHEWVSVEGSVGTVGISEHAQDALGDVVYVDLPETESEVQADSQAGTIESVKAASDINSPVSGHITEVNEKLSDEPTLINKSCYGDGWLFKLKLTDEGELKKLMDEQAYEKYLKTLETD